MIRVVAIAGSALLAASIPLVCGAQTGAAPAAIPSPAPSPSPAPEPVTGPAYGPNDPCTSIGAIVTRPSQTTSVCTVRPDHVLIETGYQNTSFAAASSVVQYPQTAIRVGTDVRALELDLTPPQDERSRIGGVPASGVTDVGAGLKYVLGYTPKFSYGVAVSFTAPTGSSAFSAGASTQSFALNYGYILGPVFSLAGTVSVNALFADAQHYTSIVPSLVLTAAVPQSSGIFIEIAEFTHGAGPATATRAQLLGGLTRAVTPRLQIDFEAGGSPTASTGKYRFIGVGASYYR